MAFKDESSGIAASVFLAIYSIFAPFMCFVILKRGIRTVYGFIWFFAIVRFGGQLCGVVHSILGPQYWKWLIAYLVLGAEGYFALILASFHTICKGQKYALGTSWLEQTGPSTFSNGLPIVSRLTKTWSALFKTVLIPANVLVIISGVILSGISTEDVNQQSTLLKESKKLRTIGQAMFLGLMMVSAVTNQYVMWVQGVRNKYTIATTLATPFLLVRGTFGILSIFLTSMNYFNVQNTVGMKTSVVIFEYTLGTTMELLAAWILVSPFFTEGKKKTMSLGNAIEDTRSEEDHKREWN
ncbi:CIC11C00000004666 [Sungouiella intermedia]|uniref:CIC11C00000004666 n=1 Tax=Sungouiella intermedia TaxID=45354 RepID=A0A1L0DGH7_9ASCO|nr:CIC11C00000004666 [[Candida] intermedia]